MTGLRVTYDLSKGVGSRVVAAEALCSNCSIPRYEDLQDDKIYSVLIDQYIMNGGIGFTMFKEGRISAVNLGIRA